MKYQHRDDFKVSIKKRNRYDTLGMVVVSTMFIVPIMCLMLIAKGLQWYVSILLILIYLFMMNKLKTHLKGKEITEKRKVYSIIRNEVKPMLEEFLTEDYIEYLVDCFYEESTETSAWLKLFLDKDTHFIKDADTLEQVKDAILKTGLGKASAVNVKEEHLATHSELSILFYLGDQRYRKVIKYNEVIYV